MAKERLTGAQRKWLTGLRDDLDFDRKYKVHGLTEAACERNGWAEYRRISGTMFAWRLTHAGRSALSEQARK